MKFTKKMLNGSEVLLGVRITCKIKASLTENKLF